MKSIGMSKIGLVRQRNEDRFYIGESFCIVTDGMGGYKGGEIASTMVVDTLACDIQNWQEVSVETLRQSVAKAKELKQHRPWRAWAQLRLLLMLRIAIYIGPM